MKSNQKFFIGIVFIIGIWFFIPNFASANPPSDITLAYTASTNTLSVTISHNVGDNTTHYIKNIEIKNSSQIISSPNYTSQPTLNTFTYEYQLPLTDGESLDVTATCNVAGILTRSIVISIPASTTETNTSSTSSTSTQTSNNSTSSSSTSETSTTSTPNQIENSPWDVLFVFPHFLFIVIGLFLMLIGITFIYTHKPKSWFLLHKIFTGVGVASTIVGIFILPLLSLNLVHAIIGLIGAIGMVVCIFTGLIFKQIKKKSIRKSHIWQGRIYFLVMLIAAFIGLYLYGVFN